MRLPILLLLSATLATPLAVLAAAPHDHDNATPQKIELNAGKKWATDAPLRQAMVAIRSSTNQLLPAAHAGKATPADYDALGKEVTTQIAYIVENCKLDPKADAQLHIVIGDIMSGVEAAQGKPNDMKRASGVVKIAQAVNTYGKHFDHAGWQAINLPH